MNLEFQLFEWQTKSNSPLNSIFQQMKFTETKLCTVQQTTSAWWQMEIEIEIWFNSFYIYCFRFNFNSYLNVLNGSKYKFSYCVRYVLFVFAVALTFQPEFAEPILNISVAVGRDATFTCHVRHLGGYRVSSFMFCCFLLFLIRFVFRFFGFFVVTKM